MNPLRRLFARSLGPCQFHHRSPLPQSADATPPTVSAFVFETANSSQGTFNTTFSEAVKSVRSDDLYPVSTGNTGATVTGIPASCTGYTVAFSLHWQYRAIAAADQVLGHGRRGHRCDSPRPPSPNSSTCSSYVYRGGGCCLGAESRRSPWPAPTEVSVPSAGRPVESVLGRVTGPLGCGGTPALVVAPGSDGGTVEPGESEALLLLSVTRPQPTMRLTERVTASETIRRKLCFMRRWTGRAARGSRPPGARYSSMRECR